MKSESLCSSCKQWSKTNGLENDVCEHCGELLNKERISYRTEKEKIKKQSEAESLLLVRDEDSDRKRRLKKIAIWSRVIFIVLVFVVMIIMFASHG